MRTRLRSDSRQTPLVAVISLAHALVHAIELTYAALLLTIGDEFGIDKLVLGLIANALALTFGVGALPSGLLVDRLGAPRVLRICFLSAAAASLLVAFSFSPLVLGLFVAVLGMAIGLYHPAALSLIAQAAERRGMVLGYHGVAGNVGIAIAPAMALAFASTAGWRWSYVFLAVLALAVAFLVRFLPLPRRSARNESGPSPFATKTPEAPLLPLTLIFAAFLLNGFIYRGSMTFLPTLIEEEVHIRFLGIDEAAIAGSLTALALLAGGVGQLLGGVLSDRVELERLAPLIALTLVPALLLMGFTGGLVLVAAAAFFVFFNFSSQPVYNVLLAEYVPGSAIGRGYGLSFFASFGLGSTAATFSGFLADRWGTSSVFLALAAFAGVTLLLALALWRLSRGRRLRQAVLVDTMEVG